MLLKQRNRSNAMNRKRQRHVLNFKYICYREAYDLNSSYRWLENLVFEIGGYNGGGFSLHRIALRHMAIVNSWFLEAEL